MSSEQILSVDGKSEGMGEALPTSTNQYEQELKSLKLKLAHLEEEKVEKMKTFNNETSNLESEVARLRAQIERGETTRQNLEYELTLAKKATNQVKRIAVEKEAETNNNITSIKDQLSETKTKLSEVEHELATARGQITQAKEQFSQELQQKERELEEMSSKTECSRNEANRLHEIVKEQQNSMVELQEKCTSLEAQRQSQNSTLRHQAKDLEYAVEREERIKKELEQSRERVKILEEHVEAERASHLETKFNSEVVQLRVRDLEGDLDVKKSALSEALESLEQLTKQSREFEEGFRREQEKCEQLTMKVKQLQEKLLNERKRTKEEQEEKQVVIKNLSNQLEHHQKNFDSLKKELHQAQKHQSEFDLNYTGCLKDLEKLIETFGKAKSPKSKAGRRKDQAVSSSLSPLVDQLRQILLDHQTARTNAVNEVKQMKIMVENLTRENTGYQKLMWSRDQAVEEVKEAAKAMKRELSGSQLQLANKETTCAALEVEIQELKQRLSDVLRNCDKYKEELVDTKNQQENNDQARLSFLHTIYQCLVAGQPSKTPPSDSYKDFTLDDMTRLLSDQISNHVSEMNRAKEKVAHLEEILNSKEQHVKQTQDNHEATIKKLSMTLKGRELSWQNQSKELEEHYGKLIADLHVRLQKTQEMADESWQKLQEATSQTEEVHVQNKTLKNSRRKYIKEKTILLASCSLLAGTLWPACAQIENLKRQKRTLAEMNSRLNCLQVHTRFLCETLSSELSGMNVPPSASIQNTTSQRPVLLKFRSGVVAVLALNRLVHFAMHKKTCMTVSEGPAGGLDTVLKVHCGNPVIQASEFRGVGREQSHVGTPIPNGISPSWLCNEQLVSVAMDTMNELYEKITRRDDRDHQSSSLSPNSSASLARTAKHCYQKLLNKLRTEFDNQPDSAVRGFRFQPTATNDLMMLLGNGLHRCLRKQNISEKYRYSSAQDVVNNLQNFVLGLTQRLHKVEVTRRDLQMEVNAVVKENSDLKRTVEKRQLESRQADKDVEEIREKLATSVPRAQFENLYSELSNALEREKQAQHILNKQDVQLKEVEKRLNTVSKSSEQNDVTLGEAIKNLSEAKLEIRRKEKHIRQITKDIQLVENEKRLLQEKLNDAEKAITGAARERESILVYLKGIQYGLDQSKNSFDRSSKNRSFHELSNFLANEGRLSREGDPLGPTILACQNIVNGFLEVHQHTLVIISQLEADKQQAQIKIDGLETEIKSHRSHINTLKDELAAVCQRQFGDEEELQQYDRLSMGVQKPYNTHSATVVNEERDSASCSREFLPLMRYDSLSPAKSPRKQETTYSSVHAGPHDSRGGNQVNHRQYKSSLR